MKWVNKALTIFIEDLKLSNLFIVTEVFFIIAIT